MFYNISNNIMTSSNPVLICSKAGDCKALATHVLIYINATTFQPMYDKPKHYCYHHALYMHTVMSHHERIQSRIMTVGEYMKIANAYRKERDLIDRK